MAAAEAVDMPATEVLTEVLPQRPEASIQRPLTPWQLEIIARQAAHEARIAEGSKVLATVVEHFRYSPPMF